MRTQKSMSQGKVKSKTEVIVDKDFQFGQSSWNNNNESQLHKELTLNSAILSQLLPLFGPFFVPFRVIG